MALTPDCPYVQNIRHNGNCFIYSHIDTGIHFIPVHKHAYFANARCGDMSVTNKIVQEVLTLPLHSNMKTEFVERVIDGTLSFYNGGLKKVTKISVTS